MTDDYCAHCDLPLSTCIHGNPPAPPPEPVKATRAPRSTASRASSGAAPAGSSTAGSAGGSATGSSSTRKPTARASSAPTSPPRRRTPPADFAPRIVAVLEGLGGEADAEVVMAAIEERMGESFRSGDREKGPTGELRWRTACRTARKHLADEGRLVAPQPGTWRLTD